jgi:hypothetical protein
MKYLIEQRIWDYVDGNSSPQEMELIKQLIQSDTEYKSAYQEILELSHSLKGLELDEPSLSFTRNVMEKLQSEPIPGSIKSLIDKRIINGLLFLFVSTIVVLLSIIIVQTDWSQAVLPQLELKLPSVRVDIPDNMKSWALTGFLFADIVLGLYILDFYFRRKLKETK